jgi:hypothetical protein
MSYMIKSPNAQHVKFAHIYMASSMTNLVISPSSSVSNRKSLFDSINASSGIGITVSSGNITLSAKDYMIYVVPNVDQVMVSNALPGVSTITLTLLLNGTEIENQVKAETRSTASGLGSSSMTHLGFSTISANSGDTLTLEMYANNTSTTTNLTIKEVGNTNSDSHSLFIWEIDR